MLIEKESIIEEDGATLRRLSKQEIAERKLAYKEKLKERAVKLIKKASKNNPKMVGQEGHKSLVEAVAFYLDENRKAKYYTHNNDFQYYEKSDKGRRLPRKYKKATLEKILGSKSPFWAMQRINGIASALKRRRKKPFQFLQSLSLKATAAFRIGTFQEKRIFNFGESRIYYDVSFNKKSTVQFMIESALSKFGYDVVDYKNGYAVMKQDHPNYKKGAEKNKLKIAKILNSLSELDNVRYVELVKDEEGNRVNITQSYNARNGENVSVKDRLIKMFSQDETRQDLMMIVSRDMKDFATMSTDRAWGSCMAYDSEYFWRVYAGIQKGSLISYLVKQDDFEIKDPMSRAAIHPYKAQIFDPEARVIDDVFSNERANIKPTTALRAIVKGFKYASEHEATKRQTLKGLSLMMAGFAAYLPNRLIHEFNNRIGLSDQQKKRESVLIGSNTAYGLNKYGLQKAIQAWTSHMVAGHPIVTHTKEDQIMPMLSAVSGPYIDGDFVIDTEDSYSQARAKYTAHKNAAQLKQ